MSQISSWPLRRMSYREAGRICAGARGSTKGDDGSVVEDWVEIFAPIVFDALVTFPVDEIVIAAGRPAPPRRGACNARAKAIRSLYIPTVEPLPRVA